jgi:hypothetical protein
MIRNKALHAMIIGTCIFVGSMTGVYADAAAPDTPVSIQIEQVNTGNQLINEDILKNKQNEIDLYVFEKHAKEKNANCYFHHWLLSIFFIKNLLIYILI